METQTCSQCRQPKPLTDYHKAKTRRSGIQSVCKPCRAVIDKVYWVERREDPEKMAAKETYKRSKQYIANRFVYDYLLENPCVDCGESNPVVLTFDHVRGEKIKEVSILVGRSPTNLHMIREEMAKCEVRCSNCHVKKTARDFNWYRYKFQQQDLDRTK